MSSEIKRFYEFGDFRLDRAEKVLLHGGDPVPLTPKVFETLEVFIENAGRLIEKEELMRRIWEDRFVEESNLTFNIKMLRKALSDKAQNPRFIETVPRRGYRFIAEVREVAEPETGAEPPAAGSVSPATEKTFRTPRAKALYFPYGAVAILLFGVFALGGWYARNRNAMPGAPVLSAPFALERISASGKVLHAVITPDGKKVIYTNDAGGKQSVWLRQLETANNIEIVPPADVLYFGLATSPDGNHLYLARSAEISEGQADIYRVSIFGGVPEKIIGETQGWISLSPDGAKISFVRCYYRPDESCSLWIADAADGANERKIASRRSPQRIADNHFSPDGRSIAFAAGQSENAANDFDLVEVSLETGAERELTAQKFFNIKSLQWLPDEGGLIVAASTAADKIYRIWQIFPDGRAEALTRDGETYSTLSLDKAGGALVSTQIREDFHLTLYQVEDVSAKRVLTKALNAAFAPDGKIFFASIASGSVEIWSIDGGERRQLTSDPAEKSMPIVSANGAYIFFSSNKTGEAHVWRMNSDGSDKRQITREEGGFPLFASPDGQWIYYRSGIEKTLWRASAAGADEQRVLDEKSFLFAFAPDGLKVAFFAGKGAEKVIKIVSLPDRRIIRSVPLSNEKSAPVNLAFEPGGKSLAYILRDAESENSTLWRQALDAPAPQKIGDLGEAEIRSFAFAPDGKTFALAQGAWRHDAVLLKGLKGY